ncbi:MAG: hypothetical protein GC206_16655 [Alphaproteobacteria bacterium]|nr:hypothetical protein [Alphaproteobacteria bacterium]
MGGDGSPGMQGHDDSAARVCIDFGTAASKASLCLPERDDVSAGELVYPLQIGAVVDEPSPYLVQSALLFDRDHDRVFFGGRAMARARSGETTSVPLVSFKTFLAARDLNNTLTSRLLRTIDITGRFQQRDALVLYTAFLTRLVERAVLSDQRLAPRLLTRPRRFAYPRWRPGSAANVYLAGVFDQAAAIAESLGDALLDPAGLELAAAGAALDAARTRPGDGRMEGAVFEARAAAECHLAFGGETPEHVLVFDMGAGTTDITAVRRTPIGYKRHAWQEIEGLRATMALACDEVDRLMIARFIERAGAKRSKAALDRFWRRLSLHSRPLKEALFRDGYCEAEFEGRMITLRSQDLFKDRTFVRFQRALAAAYQDALSRVAQAAAEDGANAIGVILAGGGSKLTFIQQMALHTRPSVSRIRRIDLRPVVPAWAQGEDFDDGFRDIFPQVAISIGGAVAAMTPMEFTL